MLVDVGFLECEECFDVGCLGMCIHRIALCLLPHTHSLSRTHTAPLPPDTGSNSPPQVAIIVPIVVVCVLILLLAIVVILAILFYMWRTAKNRTFTLNNTDPKLSVDISNSSSYESLPPYSQTDTPDLGRKLPNGNFEMDFITNGLPMSTHPKFEPSGPMSREDFESHVERFDANRQLLFQEEYDVSCVCVY